MGSVRYCIGRVEQFDKNDTDGDGLYDITIVRKWLVEHGIMYIQMDVDLMIRQKIHLKE